MVADESKQEFRPGDCSVLLVDDDDDQRIVFGTFLKARGFFVHTAASPREALALLRKIQIDIIVCDFHMPGVDGLSFCEYLRNNPASPNRKVPVVLFTADDTIFEEDALNLGADGFCHKQNAERYLMKKIQDLLERK